MDFDAVGSYSRPDILCVFKQHSSKRLKLTKPQLFTGEHETWSQCMPQQQSTFIRQDFVVIEDLFQTNGWHSCVTLESPATTEYSRMDICQLIDGPGM